MAPVNGLTGQDLVQSPSVLRGMSPSGTMIGLPAALERDEEAQLVREALFFVATTDSQRTLTAAACANSDGESSSEGDYIFTSEELLRQMRRQTALDEVKAANARKHGKQVVEPPLHIPEEMCDMEFRLAHARGRAAYNKLFLHNQRIIYYEVNKMWPNWSRATVMEKADFLQEGAQGLLRAIRLFDARRGVRLSTYASWHVRAFVLRALRDKSHIVRLPQLLQQDMSQIKRARYRYAVDNQGHLPSDDALAHMLQWPTGRVQAARKGLASAEATSLDADFTAPMLGGSTAAPSPLLNSVASSKHGGAAAENVVYAAQLRHTLSDAMKERDPRRSQITRLKFGLEDGVEWSYAQIAQRFNVSATVAKGIVRTEVNYLRRAKKSVLRDFVGHL